MFKKLKSLLLTDQWFYGVLVLFVGIISFSLGRASAVPGVAIEPSSLVSAAGIASKPARVIDNSSPKPAAVAPTLPVDSTALVASKSGTKYHLQTCPGAKQIKDENKLYFATTADAEAAGYKRAANCP